MRRLSALTFPIKLDLGCGQNKIDGHVGMDIREYKQEILWDINHGIPLPNSSVKELFTSHFFEHLSKAELPNAFSEIIRICLPGAPVKIIVPHADTIEADFLCHYTFWNEKMIAGIVMDSPNLELVSTSREGIHFTMNLTVKKG